MDSLEFILMYEGRKHKFTGKTREAVATKAFRFLQSKGSSMTHEQVLARVNNQIKIAPSTKEGKRKPTLTEAYHASLAMFRFSKGEKVSQKELDRRTKICLGCEKLNTTSFCTGCGGLSKATQLLNEAKRLTKKDLQFDDRIKTKYCGACGCGLPLLLATKKENLPDDEPGVVRPSYCWVKE